MHLTPRKIIHIDADAFYASVEMRERPELQSVPLAVGGSPDSRGVIATCNYLARQYGVRSAMSSAQALKRCPELVVVRPRFELYKQVSRDIQAIFRDYTDRIEPLSLDEAYLDVSDSPHCQGSATRIAEAIRQRVRETQHLTVSAGVAPNKFLAKVASDWNKPDGLFVIRPDQVAAFVVDLPVSRINGVGKVTAERMARLGIHTCGDLQRWSIPELCEHFGRWGPRLHELARGLDDREVSTDHVRKSLSTEHTYPNDLDDLIRMRQAFEAVYDELVERAQRLSDEDYRVTKRFVKVKFADFTQTTLEMLLPVTEEWRNREAFEHLLEQAWERQRKPVRLLGAGVRLISRHDQSPVEQLSLF